jgi:DNA-directed RNA polymerase subunit RPC12/RpoP
MPEQFHLVAITPEQANRLRERAKSGGADAPKRKTEGPVPPGGRIRVVASLVCRICGNRHGVHLEEPGETACPQCSAPIRDEDLATNFECGNCHQIIAVQLEDVGHAVDCPHCKISVQT